MPIILIEREGFVVPAEGMGYLTSASDFGPETPRCSAIMYLEISGVLATSARICGLRERDRQ